MNNLVDKYRKEEFPAVDNVTYLNNAAIAPLPRRSSDAVAQAANELRDWGAVRYERVLAPVEAARARLARLIGAYEDEVALVPSTSHGLSIVAFGLDFGPGDNVVTCAHEFPANVYPWWYQRDRGVEIRTAPALKGYVTADDILPLVNERTKVVAISSVEYGTGGRNDLASIAEICQSHGALLCVDGIQSLGVLPMDVHGLGIDFLSADGHKWMLGPEGMGVFFCARHNLERLRLSTVGWRTVVDPLQFDDLLLKPQPSARRFEPGSIDCLAGSGFSSSLDLLLEAGVDAIWEKVQALTTRLLDGLDDLGLPVVSPRNEEARSGIVTFRTNGMDAFLLVRQLAESGIFVATRGGGVRVSPHLFNNEDDIDHLLHEVAGRLAAAK